jgi:thymidylate synthase (FAD)
MKIIKPKFEILEQQYNKETLLEDMFKHIEICGRTCYKSEDKITKDSYKKFIEDLESKEHGAMLEHGTVYLTIPLGTPIDDPQYMWKFDIAKFFMSNKYSKVKEKTINKNVDVEIKGYGMRTQASAHFYFITTNWRVIFENRDKLLSKYFLNQFNIKTESLKDSVLEWITEPTEEHEKRYTVRFTYHLAVARDINRHRVQSIGEESTRYCNYSKSKFGSELNIIEPIWFTDYERGVINHKEDHLTFKDMCELIARGTDFPAMEQVDYWMFANMACEYAYMMNTTQFGEKNWTAQKGSLMLPLDTKTESIHTAFASDWIHFFNLRALGTTGAPRPSAKEVAWPLMIKFIEKGYININNPKFNLSKFNEISNKFNNNIEEYIKM